jgi:hypothetical protein
MNLSRTDKRNQQRIQDKLEKWVKGWTPSQKKLFEQMVFNQVDKTAILQEKLLNDCYGIAMQEYIKELSVEQINEILENADAYMKDVMKIVTRKEGEIYMKNLEDEKFREEVKNAAKKIIEADAKATTFEVAEQLAKQYKLAKKDLHIFVVEARREMKAEIKEEPVIVNKTNDNKIMEQPSKTNGKLKIKSIEVDGVYGCYKKDVEGVKTGDKVFKNILEAQAERDLKKTEIKARREELLTQMKEINKKMHDLDYEDKENSEKFAEIEEVFEI